MKFKQEYTTREFPWRIIFALVFTALLMTPNVTRAQITEIIDSTGDAGNTLDVPHGIAVDSAGNVYVTGSSSANAFKITPGGVITEIIDSTGDGAGNALDGSKSIAVDSAGNVYVAGNISDNAFKITPAGVITEIIDSTGDGAGNTFDNPVGIAVDSAGNVYVTGFGSDNAFKITSAGVITEIIDSTGDGAGNTLDDPFGIAVDSAGNVYVVVNNSDNAFKITPAGVITEIIDSTGDGAGNTFVNPFGIAVDSAENVYVTSATNDNAFKITSAGVITEIIDSTGDGAGNTFDAAQRIAVDSAGNVYVTGALSDNAFKITPAGVITEIIDSTGDGAGNTFQTPVGIAVDSAGNVYVTGSNSDNAFKISLATPIDMDVTGNGSSISDGDTTPDLTDHSNFGSVAVGTSQVRTFTIESTGTGDLTVSAINIGGANAADFVDSAITLPATIGSGSNQTFNVTYTPPSAGSATASISIDSNDPDTPYTFSIAGIGVNSFDASDGTPGQAGDGSADAFTITQSGGNLVIVVNGITITTLPDSEAVTINGSSDDDTLTLDLGGGAMPNITYNGGSGTDSLVLVNANGTTMTYTPSSTTDGTIDIDGNTLTFTGLSPITQTGILANVVIDTTAPGAQTIDIDATATDTTIDANGGFELITFSNATNSLVVNAGDGDDTISLNTYAGAAITLAIDGQDGDDTINMPYSVTAAGNTITVSGSSHTVGDTFNFDPEGNGITVNPATITGIAAGTLAYNTIETVNTVGEIAVTGNSNNIGDGDVGTSTTNHTDFGNATVGLTNVTRTFTISNSGLASLSINPISITGAGSAQFSVSSAPSALVAPGGSTTFDILFSPATTGTFTATINFVNNDADENPFDFAIEGDGDSAPSTIPTLSQWGMVILCLLMGSFGLVYMRREALVAAGDVASDFSLQPSTFSLPFDPALFKKCLLVFVGITIVGFAASVAYMGYLQMSDAIGGPLCAAVAAYFAHLVGLMKREE